MISQLLHYQLEVLIRYKAIHGYLEKRLGQHPDIIAVLLISLQKFHYSALSIRKVHYQGCRPQVTGVSIILDFSIPAVSGTSFSLISGINALSSKCARL